MYPPLVQSQWDGQRIRSLVPDYVLDIRPEPGYPRGCRGRHMAEAWKEVCKTDAPGVIWMDPDIVADPDDLNIMRGLAKIWPESVFVARHKLWPATTHRTEWVWGFGPVDDGKAVLTQEWHTFPEWVAIGFTYMPARLLNIALPHMPYFDPLTEDISLSKFARDYDITMRATKQVTVKHVHFTRGDDYMAWTRQP